MTAHAKLRAVSGDPSLPLTSSKPPMTLAQAIDAGGKALLYFYADHQTRRFERAREAYREQRYCLYFLPGHLYWTHLLSREETDGRGWHKAYRIVIGKDAVKRAYRSYIAPDGRVEDTDEPCADLFWCERVNEELKAAGHAVRLETYHGHLSWLLERARAGFPVDREEVL